MSAPKKLLSTFDATLIVIGSMIGSGIFIVSADMSRQLGSGGWLLIAWLLTGVITLLAALSYGELAGMMPQAGGQYQYIKRAWGTLPGFLYGWTLFLVIQTGTIAAVAVAFAKFTGVLFPQFSEHNILFEQGSFRISAAQILAIVSVLFTTWYNARGLENGRIIQNIFTSTKIIALLGLILLGLTFSWNMPWWGMNMEHFWDARSITSEGGVNTLGGILLLSALGTAMVGSLFSSDAWNNITFIAGEVQNPKRSIPLSLIAGTGIVTILYLLANITYLRLLPVAGVAGTEGVTAQGIAFAAQDRVGIAAATQLFQGGATWIMAILIMISTFGCNNGLILAGARVYRAMALDGLFFKSLAQENNSGVPGKALWLQALMICILCLSGKYGDLLDYVMFAVMIFYILTIWGIFRLRRTEPNAERPYRVWGYPWIPALYIILAAGFSLNILITKPNYSIPGLLIVLLGIPVYWYWKKSSKD